ncbi:hypothetical protein PMI16_01754 [Herbaspirillum sp. CF444]|uniref:hypothetical protein n=1 Tax=Herbaspirillum sp. CF444 TaxID=1144319 RepID=UPI0002722D61|nr:hypothetical protein [Herbaspirillum sp. CF444]EJL90914.1 hypothetical protein PMI16_01754 [Herbaspirillum sp. CF444]
MLRTFLILLLAIAISLEGLAAVRMVEMMHTGSAPMEMATSATSATSANAADETCVMNMSDTGKSSKSTAPCKMGDACKICQVFPSTTSSVDIDPLILPLIDTVSLLPESFLPSHDPSGLWRPPRSL